MIGGTVVKVVGFKTKMYVNCRHKQSGRNKADECAIYIRRTPEAEKIDVGDSVWWQGGFAYWTPCGKCGNKCGVDFDVRIPRVGYSGVRRPNRKTQEAYGVNKIGTIK